MKVAENVYEAIKSKFDSDVKLIDVEYSKKNDGMHLTIYIDKENGVTLDDCVNTSHMLDKLLDELNPTNNEKYFLDVSSYGLDKPLKFDWQFKKYYDKLVNVKLYRKIDDRKEFVATLKSVDDKMVVVNVDDFDMALNKADIAYITPYIDF